MTLWSWGLIRDTQALALAIERLAAFENRFVAFHGTYEPDS